MYIYIGKTQSPPAIRRCDNSLFSRIVSRTLLNHVLCEVWCCMIDSSSAFLEQYQTGARLAPLNSFNILESIILVYITTLSWLRNSLTATSQAKAYWYFIKIIDKVILQVPKFAVCNSMDFTYLPPLAQACFNRPIRVSLWPEHYLQNVTILAELFHNCAIGYK